MDAAARGEGAFFNQHPMVASQSSALAEADILAARQTLQPEHWAGPVPPMRRHFRSSIAYRLALVGEGRFDGMVTLRRTWEWDIAAGMLIATEAGARVSDRTGAPIALNTPERQSNGILCAAPEIHSALLSQLRP